MCLQLVLTSRFIKPIFFIAFFKMCALSTFESGWTEDIKKEKKKLSLLFFTARQSLKAQPVERLWAF